MEAAGWLWLKKANFLPAGTGFYIGRVFLQPAGCGSSMQRKMEAAGGQILKGTCTARPGPGTTYYYVYQYVYIYTAIMYVDILYIPCHQRGGCVGSLVVAVLL
jgi:hypothetical protein